MTPTRPVFSDTNSKHKTGLKSTSSAFTLVELIVTITILAILATIWFVSYSWYLAWTRDTNRTAQLKSISDTLELYRTNADLPSPENAIDIKYNWSVIASQWYIWKNILEQIEYTTEWIDPKDKQYFSYYLREDKKEYQLMAFLEEANKDLVVSNTLNLTNQANAGSVDYSKRFPVVYWKKLGILTDTTNTPLQESPVMISSWYLDLTTNTTSYKAFFSNDSQITASWYALQSSILAHLWTKAPKSCPDWFIWVPWNIEFNQAWFCVAQYEMTYTDATTPNSTIWWTTWNTVAYNNTKRPISKAWLYPIADITQTQAILACKSIWAHLITNNEWMTIARNIESTRDNWSSKQVWVWNLYNWVSNNTNLWCNATWWNTEPRTYATKTGRWTDITCNTKRKHTLSNGSEIWDLSGNIWEHVNKANTLDGTNYNVWQTIIAWSSNWTSWDDDWIYSQADMQKYWSALWLGIANGIWNLYYADWVSSNIFLRGGDAGYGAVTGVFTLYLSRSSTYANPLVGFRCSL